MEKTNRTSIVARSIILILSLVIGFHLLIIARVIPFDIVWGGRLKNASQMLQFEAVSIIMNLLMIAVVAIHEGFLKWKVNKLVIKAALGGMCSLFLLNTLGNLNAVNVLEKMIFTPVTLLLSILSFLLAISKGDTKAA